MVDLELDRGLGRLDQRRTQKLRLVKQLTDARVEIDELAAAADEALGESEGLRMTLSLERKKLADAEREVAP